MNNFTQYAPTEVVFGKWTENETGKYVKKWGGTRAFLIYGGGSAVRSGLIERVETSLEEEGIAYEALGGVKPNPRLSFAEEARKKALKFGADFIIGIGGGSSIDTAKAVAHGVANPDVPIWDFWTGKVKITKTTPVAAVLTISAAGSEMSNSAVLTNEENGQKRGFNEEINRCKFAIMNPELTFTLPDYQIACGITDIMMHTMERYFIPGVKCRLTDEFAEGLLRTVIDNGRVVMKNKTDYDAMAEIMWASSQSHNGLTGCGRDKDFSVHKFGQALGGMYDVAHGASLSAVWKAWAEYLYKDEPGRFSQFARHVWGITEPDDLRAAEAGIHATVSYFREIGMPTSLKELGVDPDEKAIEALALETTRGGNLKITKIKPVGYDEAIEIFKAARE